MNDGHGTTIREAMKRSMEKPACHPGCTRKEPNDDSTWVDWLCWFVVVGAMFAAFHCLWKLLNR